jgi:hypothetical protein
LKWGIGCGALFLGSVIAFCVVVANLVSKPNEREKAYFNPPPGTKLVIKELDKVPQDLKPYFVPFYFHAPETFKSAPSPASFVRYRGEANGVTHETFEVFPVPSHVTSANWKTVFPELMKEASEHFAKTYVNYRELSKGPETLPYHSYCWGMRWQGEEADASGQASPVYGRVLLVYHARQGSVLLSMTAMPSPEIESADDVGVKGDLGKVLPTFRIKDPIMERPKGHKPGR